jgi:endonuclease/exonuclease/phosphatase family metal-dependent hydrolase
MWNRMSSLAHSPVGLRPAAELGLTALTVLFGLQALRVVLPGIVWNLFDGKGWNEPAIGSVMVLLSLTPLLAGHLQRLLGTRGLLVASAGGLGLVRLLMQVWADAPTVSLGLAMACLALFFLFLTACTRSAGAGDRSSAGRFALGLLVGLALDTAIHGAFDTYDLAWQSGALPLSVAVSLVVAQWILLVLLALPAKRPDTADDGQSAGTGALVALGPFLFLQVVFLQNIARTAALTGWALPEAFLWTLFAQIMGLGIAVWLLRSTRRGYRLQAVVGSATLVAAMSIPYPEGAGAVVQILAGHMAASGLMAVAFAGAAGHDPGARRLGAPAAGTLGALLLLALAAGYYLPYYSGLPFSNAVVAPVAALLLAAIALRPSLGGREVPQTGRAAWLAVLLALPLVALPGAQITSRSAPEAVSGDVYPVRVATYNLHNGFDTEGRLGMEAIASVIEEIDPDIIALQEISRGWVISGRLDMLSWLSDRLDMPYVFGPTADPLWGNAILSRYPILEYAEYDLPPRDLPVKRGLITALVDLGDSDRLQVIATHFHHIEGDSGIRQIQAVATVEVWDGQARTVLLGDLNAEPDAPEMNILRRAGLLDPMAGLEPPPRHTWPSDDPTVRIDYIWTSPDLTTDSPHVLATTASDHMPVVGEIGP